MATSAKLVGLKTCLPPTRRTNLLAMAMAAVTTTRPREPARSKRQSESPEIRALLGSKVGRPERRVAASWTSRTVARMATAWEAGRSNPSHPRP
jgi:hypothetical protein